MEPSGESERAPLPPSPSSGSAPCKPAGAHDEFAISFAGALTALNGIHVEQITESEFSSRPARVIFNRHALHSVLACRGQESYPKFVFKHKDEIRILKFDMSLKDQGLEPTDLIAVTSSPRSELSFIPQASEEGSSRSDEDSFL